MSIRKHLPRRRGENFAYIQAKIEASLVEQVKMQMKHDKVSWSEFFRACFIAYLEECTDGKGIITKKIDESKDIR